MKSSFPIISGVVLCLIFFLTGCSATLPQESEEESVSEKPETYLIKKEDLVLMPAKEEKRKSNIQISGRVIPRNTTQLFAEVQGKIHQNNRAFKAGLSFTRGDTLIRIEQDEFALSLEAQRSGFLNALTGIMPDLKSDFPDSYDRWLSYVNNYQLGNHLNPLPEPQSNEEKFYLTSNQIYSLYFQIKSLENRLEKYKIIAPYSGTITKSNIDLGSLVTPGQLLGTLVNDYQYELEAGVPLKIADRLRINDKVRFTSNEISKTWTGRVIRMNNIVDPSTQNIPVYFRLEGKGLKSGMYLEGTFETEAFNHVTVIPSSVLGRDESVLVLENDIIRRKPVKPLEYLADSIILSGLAADDLIILNQFQEPVEGLKVEL